MQNPVTGSGGMFIGTVARVGPRSKGADLKAGDKIASLVSLSLTPLKIAKILKIHPEIDRVEVEAQAVLFESGIYAKLPEDMDEGLALAALDVAGAPAQAAKLVKPGQSVLILGAGGKSGMLVAWEAMKRVGPTGRVVGNVYLKEDAETLAGLDLCHEVVVADATKPVALMEAVLAANGGSRVRRRLQLRERAEHGDEQHPARAGRRGRSTSSAWRRTSARPRSAPRASARTSP